VGRVLMREECVRDLQCDKQIQDYSSIDETADPRSKVLAWTDKLVCRSKGEAQLDSSAIAHDGRAKAAIEPAIAAANADMYMSTHMQVLAGAVVAYEERIYLRQPRGRCVKDTL